MRNLKKKLFACMENKWKQSGFTYLSILFAMSILLLILPFFKFIYQSTVAFNYQEEMAVEQCFQFIQDEIEQSISTVVSSQALTFSNPDNTTSSINLYQNIIRRQVAGKGHEELLRGVQTINFVSGPYGIKIKIKTVSGNDYEKKIYILAG